MKLTQRLKAIWEGPERTAKALEGLMAGLHESVGVLATEVSSLGHVLAAEVSSLGQEIDDLRDDMKNLVSEEDLEKVGSDVEDLESGLNKLDDRVGDLEDDELVKDMNERINRLTTRIDKAGIPRYTENGEVVAATAVGGSK